jgi:[acyl-carrier-protein] S-malonyltransferase
MKTAFLFPGQGSQEVGMGRTLAAQHPVAAATFEEADEVLGFALSALAWQGPEHELTMTHNAQPALLVHSVAILRTVQDRLPKPDFVAGHSLGEYSAHVAVGTLRFADAVRAVRRRGEFMLQAGEREPGTMAAVLGLDDEVVEEICAESGGDGTVCVPANYNAPGQVVVSGSPEGIARVGSAASERGARRVVPLNVSGAFHSPLMRHAAADLREFLSTLDFSDPEVPVVANVTAKPIHSGEAARDILVEQLTAPVQWSRTVAFMEAEGVGRCMEIGQGKVLCGLSRRIARAIECRGIEGPEDLT